MPRGALSGRRSSAPTASQPRPPQLVATPLGDSNPRLRVRVARGDGRDLVFPRDTCRRDSKMAIMQALASGPPRDAMNDATVVSALAEMFSRLGAEQAFGV